MKGTHDRAFRAPSFAGFLLLLLTTAAAPLSAQQAELPSDTAAEIIESAPAASTNEVVELARAQLGRRYLFGGTGARGFDCSGLTRYLMRALNVVLPRTANQQAKMGQAIPADPRLLRVGDLLTFGTPRRITHIGVYVGEGRFIHASSGAGKVTESTLARGGSLIRNWIGVRRVLAGRTGEAPTTRKG